MTTEPGRTTVEYAAAEPFASTLKHLVDAIEEAGMKVFARIDHSAGALEVGLAMPPTILLLYGHPKGGTPIMQSAPDAALDLPLRVLVREDADGSTKISDHLDDRVRQSAAPVLLALFGSVTGLAAQRHQTNIISGARSTSGHGSSPAERFAYGRRLRRAAQID